MKTGGLSLEQAPPLSIPSSFFLSIPLGLLVAGYILMTTGAAALSSPWMPQALALTHAGTLGVLLMGMAGALYQMIPVIAGKAVAITRMAHLVHILLLAGLGGFIWRLLGGPAYAMSAAIGCLSIALLAFLIPLGWALLRSTTKTGTVRGMRLAVVSLVVISTIGVVLARGYAGDIFPQNRILLIQVHLTMALLGWVGGLIMAVSWQVIPMFYLTPIIDKNRSHWLLGLLLTGLVLPLVSVLKAPDINALITPGQLTGIAALPAALVIWLIHPVLVLRDISQRKRKRSDA